MAADDVRSLFGLDANDSAVLKRELEALDNLAGEAERHARPHRPLCTDRESGVVKISSVGMFATYSIPVAVWERALHQRALESRPTVRSVPGASVVERVGPALGERSCSRVEPVEVLAPGCGGIGLVEPEAEGDELPQPLEVGSAEDLSRPAVGRHSDSAPVDGLFLVVPLVDLGDLERDRTGDTLAVEIREKLWLGIPRALRSVRCPPVVFASVFTAISGE